jgi:RNA polymerase sigma factor (sigma-70 family)
MPKHKTVQVFTEYKDRLLGFVRKHLHSSDDSEDIVQEVFYQFSKADELTEPIEQTGPWLYRSTKNLIINWQNKKKNVLEKYTAPFPTEYDEETGETCLKDFADILFDTAITPETEYLRSFVWSEIKKAMSELPEAQREIFVQTEFEDLSFKEISKRSGVPVNTLLSRKHYAVKYLRKRLAELYSDVVGGK